MKYGQIPGIEKDVSRVIQGCVMLGCGERKLEEDFALLDAVHAAGMNTFDSAHVYGGGACDRVFGQWVRDRGLREKVVLMDKCCHHDAKGRRVTPQAIDADLADIQERLGFDYIDILTFHRDDPDQPVGPLVRRMNELIAAGTIGAYGASNWSVERIRQANAYAAEHDLVGFACASLQFSLVEMLEAPWAESYTLTGADHSEARQYFVETSLPLLNWSSLAGGFLSGRFSREDANDPEKKDSIPIRCYAGKDNWTRLDRARELAEHLGCSVPQVAVAWCLGSGLNAFPLTAAWTPEEAAANAASADLELSAEQCAWLNLQSDDKPF